MHNLRSSSKYIHVVQLMPSVPRSWVQTPHPLPFFFLQYFCLSDYEQLNVETHHLWLLSKNPTIALCSYSLLNEWCYSSELLLSVLSFPVSDDDARQLLAHVEFDIQSKG